MKLTHIMVSFAFSVIINATTVASTPTEIFLNDFEDGQGDQPKLLKVPSDTHAIIENYGACSFAFRSRSTDNNIYFDYRFYDQSQPHEGASQDIAGEDENMEVDNLAEKFSHFSPYENEFTNIVRRREPIEVDDDNIQRMSKPIIAGDKPILIDVWSKILRDKWVMSTDDSIYIRSSVENSLIHSIRVEPNSHCRTCILTMNMDFEHDNYYFESDNVKMIEVILNSNRNLIFRLRTMYTNDECEF